LQRPYSILSETIGSFLADDGWAISSHIALSTLMSLFPFLIFVTALAAFVGSQDLADEATKLLFGAWPDVVAKPLAGEVHSVLTEPRGGLLTFGAVLALYFSSSAIEALRVGLNRAYDTPEERPWYWLRAQSIVFVLFGASALLALAFLIVLGPLIFNAAVDYFPGLAPLRGLFTAVRLTVATLALGITLLIAHRWLPAAELSFLDILPGVAVTFFCSIGFGEAFGLYLREYSRNYVSTYAGLAYVMIALVFLYSVAAIFIFGGELNASILRARRQTSKPARR
jgi:membrane protein